jgi:hypothetical protein
MQCSICFKEYEATDKFFDSKRLKTATNRKSKYCVCISCLNKRPCRKKEPLKQKINSYIHMSDEEISNYLREYETISSINQNIYIVGPKNGPYKVGIAKDVYTRIGALQIACWEELVVHHISNYVGDARLVEELIHKTLWDKHIRGEWFNHDLKTIKCVVDKISSLGSKH